MVPDEHYFATLLWNENLAREVICKQTTFVNWDANIDWFYVKHRFCQRWGLNVLAAGSQLPHRRVQSPLPLCARRRRKRTSLAFFAAFLAALALGINIVVSTVVMGLVGAAQVYSDFAAGDWHAFEIQPLCK